MSQPPNSAGGAGQCPSLIPRRVSVLCLLFILWGVIILVRLADVMIVRRTAYLEAMARESWRIGRIATRRGRLLDARGRPLAWSTRHFALSWLVPEALSRAENELDRLRQAAPAVSLVEPHDLKSQLGSRLVLTDELGADDVQTLAAFCRANGSFSVRSYFRRHLDPRAGETGIQVGDVRIENGVEVGVSGAELEHDILLRSVPGTYRVMVDKVGHWIEDTWEQINEGRPGYDIQLGGHIIPEEE